MRRPTFESQGDIVISERTHAASNEDPDVAPSSETTLPDTKQVPEHAILVHLEFKYIQMHALEAEMDISCRV